jgi:hypothetical protein
MSVWIFVYLRCDGENCQRNGDVYEDDPQHGYTAAEQRRYARRDGWVHRGRKDYCPECAEDLKSYGESQARSEP